MTSASPPQRIPDEFPGNFPINAAAHHSPASSDTSACGQSLFSRQATATFPSVFPSVERPGRHDSGNLSCGFHGNAKGGSNVLSRSEADSFATSFPYQVVARRRVVRDLGRVRTGRPHSRVLRQLPQRDNDPRRRRDIRSRRADDRLTWAHRRRQSANEVPSPQRPGRHIHPASRTLRRSPGEPPDKRRRRPPGRGVADIGLQDDQLSLDGQRNGLFTQTLRQVWHDSQFSGPYSRFHKEIVALMPPTQTPNEPASAGWRYPAFRAPAALRDLAGTTVDQLLTSTAVAAPPNARQIGV